MSSGARNQDFLALMLATRLMNSSTSLERPSLAACRYLQGEPEYRSIQRFNGMKARILLLPVSSTTAALDRAYAHDRGQRGYGRPR